MKPGATALLTGMAVALLTSACAPRAPVERAPGPQTTLPRDPAKPTVGCPSGSLEGPYLSALPGGGGHDPVLAEQAVLHEVNRARCAEGLSPLSPDRSLRQAAELHSRDMARLGVLAHELPVPGRENLERRLESLALPYGLAAENIIEAHFMAYRSGASYRVIDPVRCTFTYSDGSPIRRHSYASLAQELVGRWLSSTGHRRNLLNPALRRHGFALASNSETALCGGLYATQVFAN